MAAQPGRLLLKARVGASLKKRRLRDQQKELVRRFATREVADDLDASGFALGGHRVQATVMFFDIRGFTTMAEAMPPEEAIELLNTYYTLMFDAISGHGGIASGSVIAGYTGTEQRATYTCVGDTVNLAARLEAHTKAAARAILIDSDTQAALGSACAAEPLGMVLFKGKTAEVEVFAVAA